MLDNILLGLTNIFQLPNIAAMFGTSPYAIQQLNPDKIKNIDVIRTGDVIRVR